MFNTQHILYITVSGVLTVVLLMLCRARIQNSSAKNYILKLSAVLTVAIHYSNIWVNYFASGGSTVFENNHILPVYPCNVVMWMLLIASCCQNKKRLLFQLLGEFCFYAGTVGGIVGVVFNTNFANTPTLADYDILKGLLSHSTMLFGCLYMLVGGFIQIRMFNVVSLCAGLGCFVACGISVNALYTYFGMTPPDGMWLLSNPYCRVSPLLLGALIVFLLFIVLCIRERHLPQEERWYKKLKQRFHHA